MYEREKIFADSLDEIGVQWIYQPGYFRVGGRRYHPDFYTPASDTYYEVAGTRQAFAQRRPKLELMAVERPEISLKVVRPDGRPYRECPRRGPVARERTTITVSVTRDFRERLNTVIFAIHGDRPISEFIRDLLEQWMEQNARDAKLNLRQKSEGIRTPSG